jgi:integrase
MGRIVIPGYERIGDSHYLRHRWREGGKRHTRRVPLPAPDDPGFSAAVAAARARFAALHSPDRAEPAPGSMAALCAAFRAGLPMRRNKRGSRLSPATVTNYRMYADRIEAEHGPKLVADLEPRHIYDMQDAMADTPGTANNYLSVLRLMLALACRRGWAKTNAAAGIPALPLGEHEPWPVPVIEAALAASTPMTRLALVTYLCSGQRGGDIIRMQHGWCRAGIMQFDQGKTGKSVAIPMHPLWQAELARLPRKSVTLLYDRTGRPFQSVETLRERLNDVLKQPAVASAIATAVAAAELQPGRKLTPHGLRKNAACYLFEAGSSVEQIGTILGMSPDMVRHYTKRIDARRIAETMAETMTGANVVNLSGPRA